MQALTTVPDVPEDELARLVKIAAEDESAQTEAAISWIAERKRGRRHRHPKAVDPDAMDVDLPPTLSSSDAAPKLSPLLAAFIAYPTSPSALRLAIRTHLTPNVAQVVLVLQVLLRWTDLWSQFGLIHNVKSKEGASEKAGSQVFKVADLRDGALPPLNNVRYTGFIRVFNGLLINRFFFSLDPYIHSSRPRHVLPLPTPIHTLASRIATTLCSYQARARMAPRHGPIERYTRSFRRGAEARNEGKIWGCCDNNQTSEEGRGEASCQGCQHQRDSGIVSVGGVGLVIHLLMYIIRPDI